jgi:hypothetical protein
MGEMASSYTEILKKDQIYQKIKEPIVISKKYFFKPTLLVIGRQNKRIEGLPKTEF